MSFDVLLANWMAAYSEITGQDVTDEKLKVYAVLLRDVPLDRLSFALEQAARIRGNGPGGFPTPADILRFVKQQDAATVELEADKAWVTFKRIFSKHWSPDVGLFGNPPELDEAGEYALRTIGGFLRFGESRVEHEGFIRKEFLAAYQRYHDTGGLQFPTREQAGRLLEKLQKELPGGGQ